ALGFFGSQLVDGLAGEGVRFVVAARTAAGLSRLRAVRGECIIALADVCEADSMVRALSAFRPDVVFHLAAHADGTESFDHVASCMRVNGLGLVHALQATVTSGAELFVYGDSAKDYGNGDVPYRAAQPARPLCSYAIVKAAGWEFCRLAASFTPLKVVGLRPTFVDGPGQNWDGSTYVGECVTKAEPVRLMGGSQTRDPLYIQDAVEAFVAAAESSKAWGHAIPIGGGQEMTVASLCQSVLDVLGTPMTVAVGA